MMEVQIHIEERITRGGFLQMFGSKLKGCITGFDRLVFKGMLRPLLFAAGAQAFLSACGILNKDYKDWMLAQSSMLVQAVEQFTQATCGRGIIPIASCHTRNEPPGPLQSVSSQGRAAGRP